MLWAIMEPSRVALEGAGPAGVLMWSARALRRRLGASPHLPPRLQGREPLATPSSTEPVGWPA